MDKILYIKYSELTLKQNNRKDFIKILINNIKFALNKIEYKIHYYYDYAEIINFKLSDLDYILMLLKNIPGIHNINIATKIESNIDILLNYINNQIDIFKQFSSFKVDAKRQNKSFPINSDEIKRLVAGSILNQIQTIKVDLHKPELLIKIEVKNNFILVWYQTISGMKGLPIGSQGNTLILLSGGIDSPVASKLMMNRGLIPIFLTFITPPHTCQESLEKVIDLVKQITCNFKLHKNIKLLVCNYTAIMHELSHIKNEAYKINLMRRSFFRIAQKVALKYHCLSLTTGESLGQVASQTQESLMTINNVLNDLIVLRPLIGLDKNTIIDYAKKFNTYDISIKQFPDSCSLFAPKHPITKPKTKVSISLENQIDLLVDLEESAFNKIEEWKDE